MEYLRTHRNGRPLRSLGYALRARRLRVERIDAMLSAAGVQREPGDGHNPEVPIPSLCRLDKSFIRQDNQLC